MMLRIVNAFVQPNDSRKRPCVLDVGTTSLFETPALEEPINKAAFVLLLKHDAVLR